MSTDEWIRKEWYIYTMEYYSAIKKNEVIPFAATLMDLEIIILSELSQRKTNIIYYCLYAQSKKKIQMNIYLQSRKRLTDLENELPDLGQMGRRIKDPTQSKLSKPPNQITGRKPEQNLYLDNVY